MKPSVPTPRHLFLFTFLTSFSFFSNATWYWSVKGATNPNDTLSWVTTQYDTGSHPNGFVNPNVYNPGANIFIIKKGDSMNTEGHGPWDVTGNEVRVNADGKLIVSGTDSLKCVYLTANPGGGVTSTCGVITIINNGYINMDNNGWVYNQGLIDCISGDIGTPDGNGYRFDLLFGGILNMHSGTIDVGSGVFNTSDDGQLTTLNAGAGIIKGSTFNLKPPCIFYIGSPDGILMSGPLGNIQTTNRNYFNRAGSYKFIFNGTVPQSTGNAFPTVFDGGKKGVIEVTNPTGVTLTNSITLNEPTSSLDILSNGKLVMNNGQQIIGNSGTQFTLHAGGSLSVEDYMQNNFSGINTYFSSAANYEFRNTHTGEFLTLPDTNTVNHLTFSNTNDNTLDQRFIVKGNLSLGGNLILNQKSLTLQGDLFNGNTYGFTGSNQDSLIVNGNGGTLSNSILFTSGYNMLTYLKVDRPGYVVALGSDLSVTGVLPSIIVLAGSHLVAKSLSYTHIR